MGKISKTAALCLTLIIAMSCLTLLTVKPANAQSTPKPYVPDFSIKFVDAFYTTTTINPYTGVNETKQISNNSIQITIKNQQYDASDSQIYYNVRVKPSFGSDWVEAYSLQKRSSSRNADGTFAYAFYVDDNSPQSISSYTTITFPVVPTDTYEASGFDIQKYYHYELDEQQYFPFLTAIPDGGKLDFQVEAILGRNSTYWYIQHPLFPEYGGFYQSAIAFDSTSGWSNTQTISIPDGKVTASESTDPTVTSPSPTVPELSWLVIVPVLLSLFTVALLLRHRKHSVKNTPFFLQLTFLFQVLLYLN